jgi:hypothetical protein
MKILFKIAILLLPLVHVHTACGESSTFIDKVIQFHGLQGTNATALRNILSRTMGTRHISTEDPTALFDVNSAAVHPASRQTCIDRVLKTGIIQANPTFEKICGAKWMSPVPVGNQPITGAKVCIDQFDYPDMPCEYPMVWTPAPDTDRICKAMGKRVCNSHEWEGACAGSIDDHNPYLFNLPSLQERRSVYNAHREVVWAFNWNPQLRGKTSRDICGIYSPNDPDIDPSLRPHLNQYYTSIGKSPACQTTSSDYKNCGSHTWPTGFKYLCASKYEVYDMHGNVAEVVNFPESPAGIANGIVTDHTERKGSFFVPRSGYPDDCRVRQPYEHFNLFSTDGMAFYQEGFRCCKDVK